MSAITETAPLEEALSFGCAGEELFGVLHRPPKAPRDLALVIVVGGPQYRVGSHRQFVHLARAAAAAGYPVLRFDFRGMGDSSGDLVTFERATPDIGAAIDALVKRLPAVKQVALWGLCDGASAALLYVDESGDRRVRGLCLANPWVSSADSQARTTLRHYYLQRLLQPAFWRKLLRGGVGLGSVGELGRNVRTAVAKAPAGPAAPVHERMLRGLQAFGGHAMVLLSGQDYTAREFVDRTRDDRAWQAALRRPSNECVELAAADHTFSSPQSRADAEAATVRWLDAWAARA